MGKLILLYTTILTGVVFLLVPDTIKPINYFPFYGVEMYLKTYIYFIFEKLIVIALAYIIASEEHKYKQETQIFFWLMVADLVDYLLTYSWVWFRIGSFPVSMNIIKTLIFGFVILRAWNKSIGSQYFG
jgi:hypothetical protein